MAPENLSRVIVSPWPMAIFIFGNIAILAVLYGFIIWRLFVFG